VHAQILVRAIRFADHAEWHIGTPVAIEALTWTDLEANGLTALGSALELVASQLTVAAMPPRGLPPVLVLVTDGAPTDDYRQGLRQLLSEPWGKHAVRVAIAIGDDAQLSVLEEFIDNAAIAPLLAKNADQLHAYIRWASTAVVAAAGSPPSTAAKPAPGAATAASVPIVAPVAATTPASAMDVW